MPKSRPRSDGLAGNDDDTNGKKEEPVVDTMFARKLSKEEKKASLEAKSGASGEESRRRQVGSVNTFSKRSV